MNGKNAESTNLVIMDCSLVSIATLYFTCPETVFRDNTVIFKSPKKRYFPWPIAIKFPLPTVGLWTKEINIFFSQLLSLSLTYAIFASQVIYLPNTTL